MQITHSHRDHCSIVLREARLQVLDKGAVHASTACELETLGFNVGVLERRFLDQSAAVTTAQKQEAA